MTLPQNPAANVDPKAYPTEGYCIFGDGLETDAVERYRASLDAMIAARPPGQRLEALVEPHVRASDWQNWLELCRHPRLVEAVQATIEASELVLLSTHLLVKPPHDGLAVAWHQDNTYWDSIDGTDVVTVWIALDDVDLENACMQVIPQTHQGFEELEMLSTDGKDLLGVRVELRDNLERSAVPIELRAGQFSIHDSFVIHGSGANTSSRRRAGCTLRYANAATVTVDLSKHTKPVYYVSGDGSHLHDGVRDIRAGKTLPSEPGEHRSRRFESKR